MTDNQWGETPPVPPDSGPPEPETAAVAAPAAGAVPEVNVRLTAPAFTDFFVWEGHEVSRVATPIPADQAGALIEAAANSGITIEQEA